jgi:hypothetical protein
MDEGRSGENVVTQTDNTKCRKERKKKTIYIPQLIPLQHQTNHHNLMPAGEVLTECQNLTQ